MKIVDELMTPGCPQCAVKHLCAALSYAADHNDGGEQMGNEFILAARALINLTEAIVGYRSHVDFAIGLLERAEREALMQRGGLDFATKVRALRLTCISQRFDEAGEAVLAVHAELHPASYMWAHLVEAARELPGMHIPTGNPAVPEIQGILQAVREDYFSLPEAKGAEGENKNQEGEPEMATKKAAVVKKTGKTKVPAASAAKATHAACKGGKCKGKSCKK